MPSCILILRILPIRHWPSLTHCTPDYYSSYIHSRYLSRETADHPSLYATATTVHDDDDRRAAVGKKANAKAMRPFQAAFPAADKITITHIYLCERV